MRIINLSLFLLLMFMLTSCGSSELNSQIEQLQSVNNELLNQVDIVMEELDLLKEENLSVLNQVDQMNIKNVQLQEDIKSLQRDNQKLQAENAQLKDQLLGQEEDVNIPEEAPQVNLEDLILNKANEVILLLKNENMAQLSSYVHPNNGVRISPYPFVNVNSDLVFSANQISTFMTDNNVYTWGSYDGSGEPIQLTPSDYYNAFIYSADFANPEQISYNQILGAGNMIQNKVSVYPNANIVEFYFSGFDPQYNGMDWQSLSLVFEEYDGDWYLVGMIKGAWTI
ncbi:hypothetical protein [Chengkuizengella axinellae]|uniref:Uncharacterized protein n=1 Tax=Chengkuizengella axinellae TaxID=3064388 RepID=A0ABT9IVZ8_9BACL|nr:hypothetical protein [Chengkuizengella sp. 2205SS18-9]MDP5273526.1 hypothetical protein [Chengkuizengella sp. 2205SS18-9]